MSFHNMGFQGNFQGTSNPLFGSGGLGGLGAAAGMNPLLLAGLLGGGQLLSGLGGLIGGASKSQKANRGLLSSFTQQLRGPAPDFLNINRVFGDLQAGLRPQIQAQAQGLSNKLGISSPLAQAGLAQSTLSSFANIRGSLEQQLAQLRLRNLMNLRGGALQAARGV